MPAPGDRLGGAFRWLWSAAALTSFGAAVIDITVPLIAVLFLDAGPLEVSLLLAVDQLPWLVFGLPAGVWVDRLPRRALLVGCAFARSVLVGSLLLAAVTGGLTLAHLFVVAAALGTLSVFTAVGDTALLPEVVGRQQLVAANGRLSSTTTATGLAGGGLAGVILQMGGVAVVAAVDAVANLAAAFSLLRLPGSAAGPARSEPVADPPDRRTRRSAATFAREVAEGIRHVLDDAALRTLTVSNAVLNLCVSGQYALVFVFLQHDLRVPPELIGVVLGASAVGGLLGALVAERLTVRHGSGPVWRGALVLGPLVGLLVPVAQPGWGTAAFLVGSCGLGFGIAVINVVGGSARQARCPAAILGRVSATSRLLTWGVIPLGAVVAGAAGSLLGVRPVLGAIGVAFFAGVLVVRFSPLWSLRSLEDDSAAIPSRSPLRAASRP